MAKKTTLKKKEPTQKTVLPDTCIVIISKCDQEFAIDHKGRTSIVVGGLSNPTTWALRTDPKEQINAEKTIYAMGTKSVNGEIGLVHAKGIMDAVALIAHLNKVPQLCLAGGDIDLKKALIKAVAKKGLNIQVN